jgi:superfamily II DNA or RNA helicase
MTDNNALFDEWLANTSQMDTSTDVPNESNESNESKKRSIDTDTKSTEPPSKRRRQGWNRANAKYEPTTLQLEVLERMTAYYSEHERGKLIAPPGFGKSYISGFFIDRDEYKRVLILTPQLSICEDFNTAMTKCGHTATLVTGNTNETFGDHSITISTYASYCNHAATVNAIEYDLVIYDEAHHLVSKEYKKSLRITHGRKLFMTATEKIYEDDEAVFDMSSSAFGGDVYRCMLEEGIAKGVLCDYKMYLCEWKNGLGSMLRKLSDNYNHNKIVMFFNTCAQADIICDQMNDSGFNAYIMTGDTKMDDRRRIIDEYTEAPAGIICNVGIVGEGVNIPCIDTIIFMEDRKSSIGIIQNLGRGLRLHPTKDFCMILMSESMMASRRLLTVLRSHDRRATEPEMYVCETKELEAQMIGHCKIVEINELGGVWKYKLELYRNNPDIKRRTIIDGVKIGNWLGSQHIDHKKGKLKPERLAALRTIPAWNTWETGLSNVITWEDKLELYRDNPDIKHLSVIDGVQIGRWLCSQRIDHKKGKLKPERLKLLRTIPTWNTWETSLSNVITITWDDKLELYRDNPDIKQLSVINGVKISRWVGTQRIDHKKGKLKPERLKLLRTIPAWNTWETGLSIVITWEDKLEIYRDNPDIKHSSVIDDVTLGNWLGSQHQCYNNGKLKPERLTALRTIPAWNTWETSLSNVITITWDDKLELYRDNPDIKQLSVIDGVQIGRWLSHQRIDHKKGKLKPERLKLLRTIPAWNTWETGLSNVITWEDKLEIYRDNPDIKRGAVIDGVALGNWLGAQRQCYNNGKLKPERLAALRTIPAWNTWEATL